MYVTPCYTGFVVEGLMKFNEFGYTMLAWEAPDSEIIQVCACCMSPDAKEISYGDESLTHCPECETIEGGYKYIHESEG